jgi:GTPase
VDTRHLARELGVPVTAMSARRGEGMAELLESVEQVAQGRLACKGHRVQHEAQVEDTVARLARHLDQEFAGLSNTRWVALRLLEGDPGVVQALSDGTLDELSRGGQDQRPGSAAPAGTAAT